jgi:hypothetical protein
MKRRLPSTPKRFGTHTHDHVIRFGSHDPRHSVANFLPHLLQQGLKRCIAAKVLIADVNTREMRCHTRDTHVLKVGLDNSVGTRGKNPKLGSPS